MTGEDIILSQSEYEALQKEVNRLQAWIEYLDIVDESGTPTGETVSRDIAHSEDKGG